MERHPLIFVMYDSVCNSVFEGQIIQLLEKRQKQNPYQPIHIVTFEHRLDIPIPDKKNIQITILKKIPFIGTLSIMYAVAQLKTFLQWFPSYTIIARGPIAGLIAKKSANTKACSRIIIQARGLLAHEYRYIYLPQHNPLKMLFYSYRIRQLHSIEKHAYHSHHTIPTTIEVVSPALKEHLFHEFTTDPTYVAITTEDIPPTIPKNQIISWRTAIRTQLSIPETYTVYCYNGSAKKWQKPEIIISFFKEKHLENKHCFLLILTTEVDAFMNLVKNNIPSTHCAILSVPHNNIYRYLSAADYGLLFRDSHIINWVSRPTKALEYQAVGLQIIHNDTIHYLLNRYND